MHRFANPTRFLKIAAVVQPFAAWSTIILVVAGLYLGFTAPMDYLQGEGFRIIYVHVPAAWMALFCYVGLAAASAISLIWKHPLSDVIARATAPVGAVYAFLSLFTGSFWGKPMWGTWWDWGDPRLNFMLVIFFFYVGYIALNNAFDNPARGAKASAILALVGVIFVPIVKFSVEWWSSIHQRSSVMKMGGPSIDSEMLWPLLIMAVAFTTYYIWVMLVRVRSEILSNKVRILRMKQAQSR